MASGPTTGDIAEQLRSRIEDYILTPSDRNNERVVESMRSYANLYRAMPMTNEKPPVLSFSIRSKPHPPKKNAPEIAEPSQPKDFESL